MKHLLLTRLILEWQRAVCVFFAVLLNVPSQAETSPPVTTLFRAGINATEGQGIAVGSDGVIYATGQFSGTGTFGAFTLTNGGAQDYWLAAYSPTGAVQWAVRAGGTGADFGADVVLDKAGNLVVAGVIQGTNDFHGVTNAAGFGNKDWFLAKYATNGVLQWVRLAGSSTEDQAYDVAVDSANNYYIGGRISGVATFGSTNVGAAGQTRAVLAKYDSNGSVLWVRDVGDSGSTETCGVGIDGNDNPLICGLSSSGSPTGPFVAKYNSTGTQLWKKVIAGNYYFDEASSVDADAAGNVYVAGRFGAATLNFGTLTLTNPGTLIRGFVAKFDSAGNTLWAKLAGSRAFDVDVTTDGSAYFTGFHSSTANTIGTNLLTAVSPLDLWIAKFDTAGNTAWITNSGTSNNDIGRAIVQTPGGSTFAIGEAGAEIFNNASFSPTVFIVELRPASTRPTLSLSISNANLVVSWPAGETGFGIETAGSLGAAFQSGQVNFTPVAGQTNVFTIPLPTTNLFIRLAKP